nr:lipase 3-like [Penaeus vannamei]
MGGEETCRLERTGEITVRPRDGPRRDASSDPPANCGAHGASSNGSRPPTHLPHYAGDHPGARVPGSDAPRDHQRRVRPRAAPDSSRARGGGRGEGVNAVDVVSSGKNSSINTKENGKVVFLQHCLLCSSADFVMNDPDQALAFILADLGYDVWLGNVRGNVYSRRHVRLSPNQREFWDYSINEIARYDVPAMLTYVREVTGSPTISYVGHSMGTAVFFAMMNYHPQINNWVRVMAAMAPVAYLHNSRFFKIYEDYLELLDVTTAKLGIEEFLMNDPGFAKLASVLCSPLSPVKFICSAIRLFLFGLNSDYVDKNYQSVILAHNPAGISSSVMRHIRQFNVSRQFQAFDYGATRNQREYGSTSPPRYSLARVTVPVGLFWSEGDWLVDPWT